MNKNYDNISFEIRNNFKNINIDIRKLDEKFMKLVVFSRSNSVVDSDNMNGYIDYFNDISNFLVYIIKIMNNNYSSVLKKLINVLDNDDTISSSNSFNELLNSISIHKHTFSHLIGSMNNVIMFVETKGYDNDIFIASRDDLLVSLNDFNIVLENIIKNIDVVENKKK